MYATPTFLFWLPVRVARHPPAARRQPAVAHELQEPQGVLLPLLGGHARHFLPEGHLLVVAALLTSTKKKQRVEQGTDTQAEQPRGLPH